jgi:hypothetical protein
MPTYVDFLPEHVAVVHPWRPAHRKKARSKRSKGRGSHPPENVSAAKETFALNHLGSFGLWNYGGSLRKISIVDWFHVTVWYKHASKNGCQN